MKLVPANQQHNAKQGRTGLPFACSRSGLEVAAQTPCRMLSGLVAYLAQPDPMGQSLPEDSVSFLIREARLSSSCLLALL